MNFNNVWNLSYSLKHRKTSSSGIPWNGYKFLSVQFPVSAERGTLFSIPFHTAAQPNAPKKMVALSYGTTPASCALVYTASRYGGSIPNSPGQ